MIDLHIHSTASDGSCTPSEILDISVRNGVQAISLTDHDTVDGVKEILGNGVPEDLEFLSGVEISCGPPAGFPGEESLHLLGYGFDVHNHRLNEHLEKLQTARAERNPLIIKKLNDLGFSLSLEEVEAGSPDGQTGRPHIARLMVEKGFVASFDEAFDRYLAKGKPAYVDKYRIPAAKAMETILHAGGIPVLAHPGLITDYKKFPVERLIKILKKDGLKGIEVHYTDHSKQQVVFFEKVAFRENLLVTGGSDFHGSLKAGVSIGTGSGNLNIGYDIFKNLKDRLTAMRQQRSSVQALQDNLGYRFNTPDLLLQALCHRSYANEHQKENLRNNETLEFLGDAVLGLCISQLLMEAAPDKNEGELSKLRSRLISEPSLAGLARKIDLGKFILLGKGEALSNGAGKDSILADTFEAVIAAVYKDCGFKGTCDLIETIFSEKLQTTVENHEIEDYKTILQEFVQERKEPAPLYKITGETGPDHDKTFEVVLKTMGLKIKGAGKTKKAAEQNAAEQAFKQLKSIDRENFK